MHNAAEGLTIFIVDDDNLVRNGLARLMRSAGHSPVMIGAIETLMTQLQEIVPDCVVLDITPPALGEARVQSHLRALGERVPVIAVSAMDDEETVRVARDLGVGLLLHKPIDGMALLDAIRWITGGAGIR